MRCWKARRILVDYMDNELPEEQYLQVREHLDECQKCLTLLKEYRAVSDICGGVRRLNTQKLCEEEADKIWAKVQAGIAIFKKGKPSMKIKISKWLRKHIGIYQPKIRPAISGFTIMVFLICGFLFLQSRQSILLPAKVRITTPNTQIQTGGNIQLYLEPEGNGVTRVGVLYTYDTVSLLTKRSRIDLTSGTTAYVYPDGTVSKPEKISEVQLKKWQDVIEGQSIQKPGKN